MKKGKRYAELTKLVDRTNNYDPQEAVALVKKLANAKFDETIEAHIRLGVDGRQAHEVNFIPPRKKFRSTMTEQNFLRVGTT